MYKVHMSKDTLRRMYVQQRVSYRNTRTVSHLYHSNVEQRTLQRQQAAVELASLLI